MSDLELFSFVALTEDLPNLGLTRGQLGTVVEILGPQVYEVEFSNKDGESYAMAPIEGSNLMRLHRGSEAEAA